MFIRYLSLLALVLCFNLFAVFSGVFGCAGKASDEDSTATSFPETCAEAQAAAVDETGDRPDNGAYTLYIDGDEAQPWEAYCYDMKRAEPKEYLSVNEADNYSQISNGRNIFETTYRRLRIDPIRLEIWPLDDTFASTDDGAAESVTLPEGREHIPLGWAEFQVPSEMIEGDAVVAEANVSLAGTAFVLDESVNEDGFFCSVSSSEEVEQMSEGTSFSVASDLASFILTAVTTYPVFDSTIREVADCTHFGSSFDSTTADIDLVVIPLAYVGTE